MQTTLVRYSAETCGRDQLLLPDLLLLGDLQVQLQLLTATVKLFLKKPTDSVQRMIQLVLSCATNETDNPDLRDRAYIYWRLLSTDPEVGGYSVLSKVLPKSQFCLSVRLTEFAAFNQESLVWTKGFNLFCSAGRKGCCSCQ